MTPREIAEKAAWKRWAESGTAWTFEQYRDMIEEAIDAATKPLREEVERLKAGRPYLDDCLKALHDNAVRTEQAEASNRALVEAAQALVSRMDEIRPAIDSVCTMAQIHGRPWTGPTYGEPLEHLRAALAAHEEHSKASEAPKP